MGPVAAPRKVPKIRPPLPHQSVVSAVPGKNHAGVFRNGLPETVISIEEEFGTGLRRAGRSALIGLNRIFFQNFMRQTEVTCGELRKFRLGIVKQRSPANCESLEGLGIGALPSDTGGCGAHGS